LVAGIETTFLIERMAGALFPSETEGDALLVGPESVAWRSTSDVRLNFAVLYPLLLQVAHPTIDAAWVHATLLALWLGGIGLMDAETRRRLQIGWTRIDQTEFALLSALSGGLTPVMPTSLKITGPNHPRVRRRAIARGPLG
jgi:uncharacterized protein (DUF2236 family)